MMRCRKTARPEVCSGYADWEKVDPLTRTGPRPVCGSVYGTAARWRTKSGRFSTPQLTAEARSCAMAGGTSQTFIATSGTVTVRRCASPGRHDHVIQANTIEVRVRGRRRGPRGDGDNVCGFTEMGANTGSPWGRSQQHTGHRAVLQP